MSQHTCLREAWAENLNTWSNACIHSYCCTDSCNVASFSYAVSTYFPVYKFSVRVETQRKIWHNLSMNFDFPFVRSTCSLWKIPHQFLHIKFYFLLEFSVKGFEMNEIFQLFVGFLFALLSTSCSTYENSNGYLLYLSMLKHFRNCWNSPPILISLENCGDEWNPSW